MNYFSLGAGRIRKNAEKENKVREKEILVQGSSMRHFTPIPTALYDVNVRVATKQSVAEHINWLV